MRSPGLLAAMAPKVTRGALELSLAGQEDPARAQKDRQGALRALRDMAVPTTEANIATYLELKACTRRVGKRMLLDAQEQGTAWYVVTLLCVRECTCAHVLVGVCSRSCECTPP